MPKKYLLLTLLTCANLAFSTATFSSAESSSASGSDAFAFHDQVFKRFSASNLDEEMPSLAQIYQDACARKTHIDGLFEFLKTHGLSKPAKDLFCDQIKYFKFIINENGFTQNLSDDIYLMAFLKGDYAIERDLMTYFVQALEKIASAPASQEHIEELYAQTVYLTRLNLQSLGERIFTELHRRYPDVFKYQSHGGSKKMLVSSKDYESIVPLLTPEEEALMAFCTTLSANKTLHETDTTLITQQTRALFGASEISSSSIIFDLNALSFYLNVERALLAACSSLQFEPEKFGFHKKVETHKDRFVLSAIMDYHKKGLFADFGTRTYEAKDLAFLKRNKEKLMLSILNDTAQGPVSTMLAKLGVQQRPQKKPKPTPTRRTSKTGRKGPQVDEWDALLQTTAPTQDNTPGALLLLDREDIDVDLTPIEAELAQESDQGPEINPDQRTSSSILEPLTRVVPRFDDYTYKRNTAWTQHPNTAQYTFRGKDFNMTGTFFDLEELRRIKELTHHKPDSAKLPNLASAQLRFHFTVAGEENVHDITSEAFYLSGGNRFFVKGFRSMGQPVHNAYHHVLTPRDQWAFRHENPEARWFRISSKTTHALDTHVAKGPWRINCADSEGILLLDLARKMPQYLTELATTAGAPLQIQGVVLGVSTYRDPCWRCRNLLQGWQWGLENALSVAVQDQALPITVSPNLPTVVFGFGEIEPDSRDFFPPRMSQEETVLSPAGESDYASNTHKLRLVAMRR
ncbi:MAG: hypothetical protein LCH26_08210 [Proteobacteria bacterium]|nr:hypothetical protein [Pseudomonadota bacterium]